MKINKLTKYSVFGFIFLLFILSCEKQKNNGFDSEQKSIKFTLENFPMIDKNLEKMKEVNLDSISISLYKNPKKEDYDEVIVFRKNNRFYAIPFFSNMYFDYWNFDNEEQKQLYPETNSTFEEQIKKTVSELNLKPNEFGLIMKELMKSVLNAETNLDLKPKIFKNYIYSTFKVDKYKSEEIDSCTKRTEKIYNHILSETNKTIRYNQFYLDSENGRIYELINDGRKRGELKFRIKVHRIDCFTYRLSL
ncbi:hypothetical protein [Chryseobacterium sp. RR2-3-20]|uniref:hypothetical protein n=1 Tax=Chryseobacterium sp. RR2-3-20 TaxID=2787626 RepID=UPI001ADEF189|nr:hypothetical protein [Chryseobacterium sp. RR2-3-20]